MTQEYIFKNKDIWTTTDYKEERQRIRDFWLQLSEQERRSLAEVEKDTIIRRMKEHQKHHCHCTICDKKRATIDIELERLYDAYYEELEEYTFRQQQKRQLYNNNNNNTTTTTTASVTLGVEEVFDEAQEMTDDNEEDDEEDDEDMMSDDADNKDEDKIEIKRNLTRTVTIKGNMLALANDFLKNDGRGFINMIEQIAERKRKREKEVAEIIHHEQCTAHDNTADAHGEGVSDSEYNEEDEDHDDEGHDEEEDEEAEDDDEDEEEEDDEEEDDDDDDEDDEETAEQKKKQRMEEGRKMFQIFAARMFEQRVLSAYREKIAQERQKRLIEELEEEDRLKQEREAKKQREREKKKDKKRQLKLQQEKERRELEEKRKQEELAAKAERERKLEQARLKREEERRQKEEERLRKEEDRRRRKLKEEEKRRKQEEELRQQKKKQLEEKKRLETEAKAKKAAQEKADAEAAAAAAAAKATQEKEAKEKEESERKRKLEDFARAQVLQQQHTTTAATIGSPSRKKTANDTSDHVQMPAARKLSASVTMSAVCQNSNDTTYYSLFSNVLFGQPITNIPRASSAASNLSNSKGASHVGSSRRRRQGFHGLTHDGNWTNGWTPLSAFSDTVHDRIFGDVFAGRYTLILKRAKKAYIRLNEIAQANMHAAPEYHTLEQLLQIIQHQEKEEEKAGNYPTFASSTAATKRLTSEELYEVLTRSDSGFHCVEHPQHGLVVHLSASPTLPSPLQPMVQILPRSSLLRQPQPPLFQNLQSSSNIKQPTITQFSATVPPPGNTILDVLLPNSTALTTETTTASTPAHTHRPPPALSTSSSAFFSYF